MQPFRGAGQGSAAELPSRHSPRLTEPCSSGEGLWGAPSSSSVAPSLAFSAVDTGPWCLLLMCHVLLRQVRGARAGSCITLLCWLHCVWKGLRHCWARRERRCHLLPWFSASCLPVSPAPLSPLSMSVRGKVRVMPWGAGS